MDSYSDSELPVVLSGDIFLTGLWYCLLKLMETTHSCRFVEVHVWNQHQSLRGQLRGYPYQISVSLLIPPGGT